MFGGANTFAFNCTQVVDVEVQAHIGAGLPSFVIVGLVNKAVSEARERVRIALASAGVKLPAKKIVINLAPADLYKEGTHFDLPIALAILGEMDIVSKASFVNKVFLGELALDGRIAPVRGVLPCAIKAASTNQMLICPLENANECQLLLDQSLSFSCPTTLTHAINYLCGKADAMVFSNEFNTPDTPREEGFRHIPCISEVNGQEQAKRALKVAACGGHNVLLNGHPGTGKSMLAERFIGLLPSPTKQEAIEIGIIYSMSGGLENILKNSLSNLGEIQRPFRAPHHSSSMASIIGGGRIASPGEISLAHRGVLFLDELPEFERRTLDALRQPLETGEVTIARAEYHVTIMAKFQLIAAMNPCKCGYFGNQQKQCRKIPHCAMDYESKISGPILDRIDIFVDVMPESLQTMFNRNKTACETSKDIRALSTRVRLIQQERYKNCNILNNSELTSEMVAKHCHLENDLMEIITKYEKRFGLSARGLNRVLKVARTIADMEGEENITKTNLLEALSYRKVIAGIYNS